MRCPICSEPWELDSLHDLVAERNGDLGPELRRPYEVEFDEVRRDFTKRGCKAFGARHNDTTASPLVGEVYALLGDDIDGAISLLEDAEALGVDL